MVVFKDITHINNFSEYLPLLNSCLIVELLLIIILYSNSINSFHLKKWYQTYKMNALIIDVFVLLIFLVKTVLFYKYAFSKFNILKFIGLAIYFQLFNESWFYLLLLNITYGYNNLLDYFKKYTEEGHHCPMGGMVTMPLGWIEKVETLETIVDGDLLIPSEILIEIDGFL